MAPIKHGAINKKQKVGEGTSRGRVQFDDHGFLGILQEERYRELSSRRIWSERRFDIHPEGCFINYVKIITDRCWEKLANSLTNLHYKIIKEFYANALPIDGVDYPFVTMVWGKMIPFDRNAINEYLGKPLTLEEGEIDAFSKRMQRGNWNIGRTSQSLLARGRTVVKNVAGLPIKFKKEDMKTRA